ncbi:MAG: tetratricopeptide repeat protein [Gammaproteobacteria bacterium]|nr:tetratricopeptide repeat protein [Gammaproteobacteria bacterium]
MTNVEHAIPAEQWEEYCRTREEALDNAGWARVPTARSFEWRYIAIWFAILAVFAGAKYFLKPDRPDHERIVQTINQTWDAYRSKDYVGAQALIPQVEAQLRDNYDFQMLRAEVGTITGNYHQTRDALKQARELRTDLPAPDIVEANLLIALGKPEDARKLLLGTVKRFPTETGAYVILARATQHLGSASETRRAWEDVLIRQPADPDALFALAYLEWKTGDKHSADGIITDAIAALPSRSAVLESALSRYYTTTGRPEEAVPPARLAQELAPYNPRHGHQYVMALLHNDEITRAVEQAQAFTLRMPNTAFSWNSLATAAAMGKRPKLAEPAFLRWLEIAPYEANAHSNFGFFLHTEGRSQEARNILKLATHSFPGNGMVWLNYAVVLKALGDGVAANNARKQANALLTDEQRTTILR